MSFGLRTQRTREEELHDAGLTLALLELVAPESPAGDRLKVAKLLFLATHRLFSDRVKALNFGFYRYAYGPFTRDLYVTWGELAWAGLLEVEEGPTGTLRLTAEGHDAAREFLREVLGRSENEAVLRALHLVADAEASAPTGTLLRRVYDMQVTALGTGVRTTIRAAPIGTYFTRPLELGEARARVAVPTEWLDAFNARLYRAQGAAAGVAVAQTPEMMRALREALEAEARGEGRFVSLEEVRRTYGIGA